MNRYQTINSFTRTPVCTQLVSYIVYTGQALTFFLCMYPNFNNQITKTTIFIMYICTTIGQAIISFICSYIDPSDNIMIQFRNSRTQLNDLKNCLYCDICRSYVKQSSRHCKQCQRCVSNFDHHCIWINNCIGDKNYKLFFCMITLTLINMLIYLIGVVLLWIQNRWRQYIVAMIFLWIFSVIILILAFLLTNLILLHLYLNYKGLTTYQFIMLQRQEQKKKKEAIQKKESQFERSGQHQITVMPIKQNQIKNNNNFIQEQIKTKNKSQNDNQNIIFGNYMSSSHNTEKQSEHQLSENKQKKQTSNFDNDNQDNSLQSKNASSVNLSQFFTRNKSLKFLVGDQIGQRPKTSKAHNQESNYTSLKNIKGQIQKMKKIKQKQLQFSTLNNKNKQMSTIEMGKLNPLKIFPKK